MTRNPALKRWIGGVSVVPGLGVAMLSKFTCSLCVAAYAGMLSSLGLGFLATSRGLTVFTGALLAAGLLSLWWSARAHGHHGPLVLTLMGSALLLAGRLAWSDPGLLYSGGAAVFAASVWNLWYVRRPRRQLVGLGDSHQTPIL